MHVASSVFTASVARPQAPITNTSIRGSEYSQPVRKFRGFAGAGYVLHDLRMKGGKQGRSKRLPFDMAKQRRIELDELLITRTGSLRLDTDDASFFAPIYAHHCDTAEQAIEALRARFPALGEVGRLSIVTAAFARPRRYRADPLAAMLNVTFEERQRLGLRTIGACDISREDRDRIAKASKSECDRARKARKRREAGAASRNEYLANSITAEAKRLGVSRMTLYRRRRAAEKAREEACYRSGATIEYKSPPNSAGPVTPQPQPDAAAQPAAVPSASKRASIWLVAAFSPSSLPLRIPIVAANSDPATARLATRVSAHAAAHRKAARVFAMMRRAA